MKKITLAALLLSVAVVGTGCTSVRASKGANKIGSGPRIVAQPTYKADWTVGSDAVRATATVVKTFGIVTEGSVPNCTYTDWGLTDAEKAAVYNACKAAGCDKLLGMRFETETTGIPFIFSVQKATVVGFPATLTAVTERKEVAATKSFFN